MFLTLYERADGSVVLKIDGCFYKINLPSALHKDVNEYINLLHSIITHGIPASDNRFVRMRYMTYAELTKDAHLIFDIHVSDYAQKNWNWPGE